MFTTILLLCNNMCSGIYATNLVNISMQLYCPWLFGNNIVHHHIYTTTSTVDPTQHYRPKQWSLQLNLLWLLYDIVDHGIYVITLIAYPTHHSQPQQQRLQLYHDNNLSTIK